MDFYFRKFENRKPFKPVPYSPTRELLYQFLAVISIVIGAWYIHWRWTDSINWNAIWFSIPLVIAETCAYIGLIIFTINIWKTEDTPITPPPRSIKECSNDPNIIDRPISVDIFIATYNEDPELVRLSIQDAKGIRYPYEIDAKISVLDDGRRPEMKKVADEEGVGYITRDNNIGFKAGNLRNAMEQTFGDFIVICDADTRPFPTFLERTLGYFRDPNVAWVQSPHYFYDLTEGTNLRYVLKKYLWYPGYVIGAAIEKIFGEVKIGEDRFVNDPQMFFDVIQRRRNWANASFCCGAGSIHRREAIMEAAVKTFADSVDGEVRRVTAEISDPVIRGDMEDAMKREMLLETEMTPYKFHVSEDIYTSIVLHSDREREWKSVYHPFPESKMLSPQDLLSWTIQRFKYAGGSLDIAITDNPVFKKGLRWPQKLMYGATFWSYFSGLWNIIFLLSPVIYLFTGVAPVDAYSFDFFKHALAFLLANSIAQMVGTWGVSGWGGSATYLAFFPINMRALWTVLKGEKIKFPTTPKDRQEGNFIHLVWPQLTVIGLTIAGLLYAAYKIAIGQSDNYTGLITNTFWGLNNVAALSGMVFASLWKPKD
ncbi:MAG TPA: glycosyltransferase [Patescibacteria group bacterium]|nr:glycosyltransferase [Patescibacteria group bacterium]